MCNHDEHCYEGSEEDGHGESLPAMARRQAVNMAMDRDQARNQHGTVRNA